MAKDSLARGARSAVFGGPSNISQEKWDAMWKSDSDTKQTSAKNTPAKTESK